VLVAVTESARGPARLSPLKRLAPFRRDRGAYVIGDCERGEKCPKTSALRAVFSAETGSKAERSDSEVDRFIGDPGWGGFAENGGGGFADISEFSPAAASASPAAACGVGANANRASASAFLRCMRRRSPYRTEGHGTPTRKAMLLHENDRLSCLFLMMPVGMLAR
jgi:hypothetical protein